MYTVNVVVYVVAVTASFWGLCTCKNCVTDDRCKCTFDDNSGMIDLWSTARRDGYPLFTDQPSQDGYMYSYNPCVGFAEGTCSSVSVCQFDSQFIGYYDIGTEESAAFSYDGLNVIAEYTSADGTRKTYVTLVCDPSATTPTIDVQGEKDTMHYFMTMTSSAACPFGGSSGVISAGSILLIVFFSLLIVYLVAGIAFNKIKTGATGKELIPNREKWTSLPSLVKDGCSFTIGLICRRRRGEYGAM